VKPPQLFATYLRYGALVCGPPAIDREFKTIDWFVLLDTNTLDPRTFRSFFAAATPD
jgi:putative hemolysin